MQYTATKCRFLRTSCRACDEMPDEPFVADEMSIFVFFQNAVQCLLLSVLEKRFFSLHFSVTTCGGTFTRKNCAMPSTLKKHRLTKIRRCLLFMMSYRSCESFMLSHLPGIHLSKSVRKSSGSFCGTGRGCACFWLPSRSSHVRTLPATLVSV